MIDVISVVEVDVIVVIVEVFKCASVVDATEVENELIEVKSVVEVDVIVVELFEFVSVVDDADVVDVTVVVVKLISGLTSNSIVLLVLTTSSKNKLFIFVLKSFCPR